VEDSGSKLILATEELASKVERLVALTERLVAAFRQYLGLPTLLSRAYSHIFRKIPEKESPEEPADHRFGGQGKQDKMAAVEGNLIKTEEMQNISSFSFEKHERLIRFFL